ncbi:MAG: hypothetical protein AB1782_11060 [Cyanobacteriota bacterium]
MNKVVISIVLSLILIQFSSVYSQNYWGEGYKQSLNENPNSSIDNLEGFQSPSLEYDTKEKKVVELPDVPDVPDAPVSVDSESIKSRSPSSPILELGASTEKIPVGTKLNIVLNNNLNAKKSKEGDPFSANIKSDVLVEGKLIIPAGTLIRGRIGKVKKPRIFSKSGSIVLNFDHIVTPLGKQITLDMGLSQKNKINKKGALVANEGFGEAIKESAKSGINTTKTITKASYDVGMAAGKVPVVATVPAGAAIGTVAGTTVFATKSAIAIFQKGGNPIFNSGDELEVLFSEELDLPVN